MWWRCRSGELRLGSPAFHLALSGAEERVAQAAQKEAEGLRATVQGQEKRNGAP